MVIGLWFNLVSNHKHDFKMDLHERSAQARFGITRRSQLDSFRNRTIVRVWCIAPAGLLKIAEPYLIKYAKRCHAMKSFERTVITKKHASSLQSTSCI